MPLMSFHTQRAAFERAGRRQAVPDRPRAGRAGRRRRARAAARPAGRDRRRASRPRPRPATWCRSTPSCSSSPRSSCSTRRASSSCSTPSRAAWSHDGPLPRRGVRDQVRPDRDPGAGGGRLHRRRRRRRRAPARRYEIGREEDGLVQPMTLMFRMVQFERAGFEAYVREHPDQWRGVHGLWDLIRAATRRRASSTCRARTSCSSARRTRARSASTARG